MHELWEYERVFVMATDARGPVKVSPPAARLKGLSLASGWKVIEEVQGFTEATGGQFSCPYIVEKKGRRAFLKALDYSKAEELAKESGWDVPTALQYLVAAYNFERNLLRQCAER